VRSRHGGCAKDKVQTIISTDVMISVPTTRHPPPGAWLLLLSKSLDLACRSVHGGILSSEIASVFPLESVLASDSEVYLGAYSELFLGVFSELTWECIVKQAGSVPSSSFRSVLESMHGSAIESLLRGYLEAYSQAGWERVIEFNWECT
jgi:hypothetical protein